ncbi:MAG: hypothetical protein K2J65_05900 [Duncaniella sp.]|nr:hypothetical protein [Duncaniella sp.]
MAGNLRIAKNALYLYIRTIVSMIVGIFSVRIMLEALGVDDYGLLNVAGGVLGMFAFLTESLGTSTSRYITFELGRGDLKRINDTFCTSMFIFIGIAVLMVILGETVGLWILRTKLLIPAGRETAAEWVFHLSVIGTAIGIPQAPYNACMIAHEKFNISAYLSLYSSFARLGILYLVSASSFDHLIYYAILNFIIGLSTLAYSRWYCITRFPEAKFHWKFDKELLKPMLKFSFWEIFGSVSRMLKGTGFNMVINMFFGVAINAAIGIGNTVAGAVTGLAFTVTTAFKPGMVKHFARNDFGQFKESLTNASLISMILYGIFGVPLLVELNYVMGIWLTEIPEYSREICIIQLLANTILMVTLVTAESLKSMGTNMGVNLVQCFDGLFTISVVFAALYIWNSPLIACIVFNFGILWYFTATCYLLSRRTGIRYVLHLIYRTVIRVFVVEFAVYTILRWVHTALGESLLTLLINCSLSVILFTVVSVTFLLSRPQQQQLILYLKSRYRIARQTA